MNEVSQPNKGLINYYLKRYTLMPNSYTITISSNLGFGLKMVHHCKTTIKLLFS